MGEWATPIIPIVTIFIINLSFHGSSNKAFREAATRDIKDGHEITGKRQSPLGDIMLNWRVLRCRLLGIGRALQTARLHTLVQVSLQ
jgi:hypothetical protein